MIKSMTGKILWIDLTTGEIRDEHIPEAVYEQFLGGMGLAAHLLIHRIPPGADPLGPDNVFGVLPGLLTGTESMMTGRWMAVAKSPLTGTWGDANAGGMFAPAIKQCGYDGIFFTGISPKPVYLLVDHDQASLRDATGLWGLDTRQTEDALSQLFPGRQPAVICIGPAGERLSLISGISTDQGRMAARSGLGAVMGSKRLKAVVLNGAHLVRSHNPEKMRALTTGFARWARFVPPFLKGRGVEYLARGMRLLPLQMRQDGLLYKLILQKWGTSGLNQFSIETGDAPIKNWSGGSHTWPARISRQIDPDLFRGRELTKYHCYSCPIGCGGYSSLNGHGETHKPEYETILAWSGLLMNEDFESIFELNEQLNRAGLDSISAGGTVAYAIECFERGLLTLEDTGGLELRWGNTAAIRELLGLMISREGIGDILADGSRKAAERIGRGSAAYAVHAGGQELAMHDPRNDPGFALHAAVEATPGRHTLGAYQYYEMFQLWTRVKGAPRVKPRFYHKNTKYTADEEKAAWAAQCSRFSALMNAAGLCMFGAMIGVQRIPIFEWLNAATGLQKTPDEYMQIGQDIHNLRQAFNLLHGAPARHAVNPRALGAPPQEAGANRGRSVQLNTLVRLYWQQMDWDENGRPKDEALQRIGVAKLLG
jgi:aldehyde:ferredoxin oxidoreductase